MGQNSKIQWCDHAFNPWRGCSKVSPGCANCYAEALSKRNPAVLGEWGPNGTRVIASESIWREPLKWNRKAEKAGERRRVFCSSLADVFEHFPYPMCNSAGHPLSTNEAGAVWSYDEETISDDWGVRDYEMDDVRARLFLLIRQTPALDWLLLTKRPENIDATIRRVANGRGRMRYGPLAREWAEGKPPSNVWLGVSVEDQQRADERIPILLQTPAFMRFLSVEPLLGPVEFDPTWIGWIRAGYDHGTGKILIEHRSSPLFRDRVVSAIDWVIVGGESGPNALPCNLDWIRSIVLQCREANVPCFMKQLGSRPFEREPSWWSHAYPIGDRLQLVGDGFGNYYVKGIRDPKGGDPDEWPEDLRIREFPRRRVES